MLAKFQEDSFVLSALHQMMMQVVVIFGGPYKYVGVVVWNMFCFFHILGISSSQPTSIHQQYVGLVWVGGDSIQFQLPPISLSKNDSKLRPGQQS